MLISRHAASTPFVKPGGPQLKFIFSVYVFQKRGYLFYPDPLSWTVSWLNLLRIWTINSQEGTKRTGELNERALNMTYFESIKLFIISRIHMNHMIWWYRFPSFPDLYHTVWFILELEKRFFENLTKNIHRIEPIWYAILDYFIALPVH